MISLAFLAGALAAFNPCGFVLLPAYLASIILNTESSGRSSAPVFRAIKFSFGMVIGFTGVFGGFALFLTSLAGSIGKFLPLAAVVVGIALIAISISLIREKTLILKKLANPNIAPTTGWLSQIGYGVSFALASLSCTIGPFLAITAAAVHDKNAMGIFTLFLFYSLGMGSVVLILALLVAAAKSTLINRIKGSQRKISIASGYMLLAVGIYEVWYGWYEIRALRGLRVGDPITSFATSIQSKITQAVADLGTQRLAIITLLILTSLLFLGMRKRSRNRADKLGQSHDT